MELLRGPNVSKNVNNYNVVGDNNSFSTDVISKQSTSVEADMKLSKNPMTFFGFKGNLSELFRSLIDNSYYLESDDNAYNANNIEEQESVRKYGLSIAGDKKELIGSALLSNEVLNSFMKSENGLMAASRQFDTYDIGNKVQNGIKRFQLLKKFIFSMGNEIAKNPLIPNPDDNIPVKINSKIDDAISLQRDPSVRGPNALKLVTDYSSEEKNPLNKVAQNALSVPANVLFNGVADLYKTETELEEWSQILTSGINYLLGASANVGVVPTVSDIKKLISHMSTEHANVFIEVIKIAGIEAGLRVKVGDKDVEQAADPNFYDRVIGRLELDNQPGLTLQQLAYNKLEYKKHYDNLQDDIIIARPTKIPVTHIDGALSFSASWNQLFSTANAFMVKGAEYFASDANIESDKISSYYLPNKVYEVDDVNDKTKLKIVSSLPNVYSNSVISRDYNITLNLLIDMMSTDESAMPVLLISTNDGNIIGMKFKRIPGAYNMYELSVPVFLFGELGFKNGLGINGLFTVGITSTSKDYDKSWFYMKIIESHCICNRREIITYGTGWLKNGESLDKPLLDFVNTVDINDIVTISPFDAVSYWARIMNKYSNVLPFVADFIKTPVGKLFIEVLRILMMNGYLIDNTKIITHDDVFPFILPIISNITNILRYDGLSNLSKIKTSFQPKFVWYLLRLLNESAVYKIYHDSTNQIVQSSSLYVKKLVPSVTEAFQHNAINKTTLEEALRTI